MARRYLPTSSFALLRAYYGLSQEELADYLGISTGVLAMAETAAHLGRGLPFGASVRFTKLVEWRPMAAAPVSFVPNPDEAARLALERVTRILATL